MTNGRETVGKISSELLLKPEAVRVTEMQQEMQKDHLINLFQCVDRGKKDYPGDFFIVVLTKKERLMPNVMRDYFLARSTCPTPNYDQAVYMYHFRDEKVEFLWVIPDREMCFYLLENIFSLPEEQQGLARFVIEWKSGKLFELAQRLNKEFPE